MQILSRVPIWQTGTVGEIHRCIGGNGSISATAISPATTMHYIVCCLFSPSAWQRAISCRIPQYREIVACRSSHHEQMPHDEPAHEQIKTGESDGAGRCSG